MSTPTTRAWCAGALSALFPGLGQAYNRQWTKAVLLALLAASTLSLTVVFWPTMYGCVVYLALWLSAIPDAYKTAQAQSIGQWYYAKAYVVMMLLATGPLAIPLLWRSPQFTQQARWGWTVLVISVAALIIPLTLLVEHQITRVLAQPDIQSMLDACGIDTSHGDMARVLRELIQCLR